MSKKHNTQCSKRTCVLCGRTILPFEKDPVIGATGRIVCGNCISISKKIKEIPIGAASPKQSPYVQQNIRPSHIVNELDKAIIGQAEAKHAIAIALWKQLYGAAAEIRFPKTHLLLYGPTGCGKTALLRKAAEVVDLPFLSVDCTTVTETGYKGRDVRDIVRELNSRYRGHPRLKNSVIFFDEFDKLAAVPGSDMRAVYNRGTQHSYLKFIEGETVTVDDQEINTASFLFVFGGAFTALHKKTETVARRSVGFLTKELEQMPKEERQRPGVEDFIAFGMEPELLGRIGQFVPLDPLTAEDMTKILFESELSAYLQYKRLLVGYGIDLTLSKEDALAIAETAAAQQLGARGLNTLVEQLIHPLLFDFAEGKLKGAVPLKMKEHTDYVCVG